MCRLASFSVSFKVILNTSLGASEEVLSSTPLPMMNVGTEMVRKMKKKLLRLAVAFASAMPFMAFSEPTVTDVTAKQRYPWNGLVDITCTVSGIDVVTNGLKFAVAAVDADSGAISKVSLFWIVQDGTNSTDYAVHTNGDYRLIWDARVDLGQVICSNMVLRVALEEDDGHEKVQLWENGPYWAKTNIGADEPWEQGCYFWWGDIIGYKRENNAWVASDVELFVQ